MKKLRLIISLTALIVMMTTAFSFASSDSLKLLESYPKDGQNNTSIENVGVKLYFDNSVSSAAAQKNNKDCVKIIDGKGNELPIEVLTSTDSEGLVLVLADNTSDSLDVQGDTEYTLVIDKDFVDDEGNTLGSDKEITFTTFNQSFNMRVNIFMMVAMFGGIMFLTTREANKKKKEEEPEKQEKKESFNPYKEAKRTGESVEEIIAKEKKRREKEDKKKAKAEKAKAARIEKVEEEFNLSLELPNVYKVSKPRPISKAGGKYKSGKKVEKKDKADSKKNK